MKITTRFLFLLYFIFFATISSQAQNNVIVLTPTPTGSEGSTVSSDESVFQIDASTGSVSYFNSSTGDDWTVTPATTSIASAKGKQFKVKMGGMATTNTTIADAYGTMSANYGDIGTAGGIDRSSTGELGVVGGVGGGIQLNEGMWFGLDATSLPTTVYLQISKIKVRYARTLTGVAVNRTNTINFLEFGNGTIPSLVDGQGWIDVAKLNCVVNGGTSTDNLLALFNAKVTNSADNFRITGIELKLMENLDFSVIKTIAHPRLLLKVGEESKITTLIQQSADFQKVHKYILDVCDSMLLQPALVYYVDAGDNMAVAQEALSRIMYLSYGYRMTGNTNYLNKALSDINTVCDFPEWNASKSLDVCEMAFAVGLGYDWLTTKMSIDLRTKVRTAILNKALKTQTIGKDFWNSTSNWNQVCIGGLSLAAMAIYGDGTTEMDTYSKTILDNILLKNPNSMNTYNNGNYSEGPMYWNYGTTYEVLMLSTLEGIYGTGNSILSGLINTPGFLQSTNYMQFVTGTSNLLHNYADGVESRSIAPATFWMAKRLNDPSVLYVEKELMRTNRYTPLNSPDDKLPIALIYGKDINISNLQPPTSSLWVGNGLQPVAFVRTGWQGSTGNYIGIKAGTPYNSHAHMDGGSFVYDSQGVRWAMDFGKEDYTAIKNSDVTYNSYEQNSTRWDVFRHDNISHNTISIKKTTETKWQHHVVNSSTTIDETYETSQRKGAKLNMIETLGLNNELNTAIRTITTENNALKVVDSISNGASAINLYWNMATRATAVSVDASTIKLTQNGKTALLKVVSSNPAATFTMEYARSTDPITYDPTHTYERKNPGTIMVGFVATIPANTTVNFTVTLTDGAEVPPSVTVPVNQILLEIPTPLTAGEGNTLYYDESRFDIDTNGKAGISGAATDYAWTAYGSTNLEAAKGNYFLFRWEGMASTNTTNDINFGALLTHAGLDRDTKGEIGVRGGASSAIDPNEGFRFGMDLTGMSSSIKLQLSYVKFNYLTSSKQVTIVNRDNIAQRKITSTNGFVDVRTLNITAIGGANYPDIASFFNSGTTGNAFRLAGFKFDILSNSAVAVKNLTTDIENPHSRMVIVPGLVKDNFNIKYSNPVVSDVKIQLFNMSGACVYSKDFSNLTGIDIPVNSVQMESGVYLCQIIDNEGVIVKKIIK